MLVAAVSNFTTPRGVFTIAAGLLAGLLLLAFVVLKEPQQAPEARGDVQVESSRQRALSAQASLRGVVLRARAAREAQVPL